jgi:cysteinyl-tRNA synthetase
MELVERYTRSYFEDMDALRVIRPNISPRASCHIPEQIELVKQLIEKGYAYATDSGDVYFSVEKFPEYGKLSGRNVDDLEHGARVAVREDKHHPADFALWKHAEPEHILRWSSPWGEGYPGWHVECSAMSSKYLGETLDIHGGGLENMFPHNECEIAQSEAATGKPFTNYWILTGSLTVDGVKMSKSLGNFLTLKDALRKYSPEAIRAFVLSAHYRGPVDFSNKALVAAEQGIRRLHNTVRSIRTRLRDAPKSGVVDESVLASLASHQGVFLEAMDDDFNTPRALAALYSLAREINQRVDSDTTLSRETFVAADDVFQRLGGDVLGIIPDELTAPGAGGELLEGVMELLLELRQEYRAVKDWERSDRLRDRLAELGVRIDDRPDGSTWHIDG